MAVSEWTPPSTIGGTWARCVNGIYEFRTTDPADDPLPYRVPSECPGHLALCGVPCGCRGLNASHYPVKVA